MAKRITECAKCGWAGSYNPECDCIECSRQSEAHRAQHNNDQPRQIVATAQRKAEARAARQSRFDY
jgi:hypothetical protein